MAGWPCLFAKQISSVIDFHMNIQQYTIPNMNFGSALIHFTSCALLCLKALKLIKYFRFFHVWWTYIRTESEGKDKLPDGQSDAVSSLLDGSIRLTSLHALKAMSLNLLVGQSNTLTCRWCKVNKVDVLLYSTEVMTQ